MEYLSIVNFLKSKGAIILVVVIIAVLELIGIEYGILLSIAGIILAIFTGGVFWATLLLRDSTDMLGQYNSELVNATKRLESATRLIIVPRLVFDGDDTKTVPLAPPILSGPNTTAILQIVRIRNKGVGSAAIKNASAVERSGKVAYPIVSNQGMVEPVIFPGEVFEYRITNVKTGDLIRVTIEYEDLEQSVKRPLEFYTTVI